MLCLFVFDANLYKFILSSKQSFNFNFNLTFNSPHSLKRGSFQNYYSGRPNIPPHWIVSIPNAFKGGKTHIIQYFRIHTLK